MRKETNLYLNENRVVYDIYKNEFYNPEDIVENFKRALDYDGCKSIKKKRLEHDIKYTAKLEDSEYYNLIIPVPSVGKNIGVINKMDNICRIKSMKNLEMFGIKLKKVLLKTAIVLGCGFALYQTAQLIKQGVEKVVEWDNEKFEDELEESGAKEMQQNLEIQKNHEEAMEHYYQDQKIEEQLQEQQTRKFEEQLEQINQEYTQKMIDDMDLYRDFDTMPGVTKIEESDVKVY